MQNSLIDFIFFYDDHIISEIKNTKKYDEYVKNGSELHKKLMDLLDREQSKLFEELFDCEMGMTAESTTVFFKAGFKIGLRLAFESING